MNTLIPILWVIYGIFSVIVGEMMIRPFMMNWYRNQIWITRTGPDPMQAFVHQGLRRISFEVSIALISIAVGGLVGWAYLIMRFIRRKSLATQAAEARGAG